jgi:formylglycine-generating enzyme required for sulfatase activity
LLDAAGNVWEWAADPFDPEQHRKLLGIPPRAPAPTTALRVARGGAWNAHPPQLRCANRNAWPPDARYSNIGLRLAR